MAHQTFWAFCLLACLTGTSLVEGYPGFLGRGNCPEGAAYYRQHCYQPFDMPLTWDAAEIECQYLTRGGHLATFWTAADERIVSSYIKRSSAITDAWSGMHAVRTPNKLIWEWIDGTPYTPGSPLWDNRVPSTPSSTSECISVTNIQSPGTGSPRWTQISCETAQPFICKYRASFYF